MRPNYQHLKALQDLADSLGLGHLLTDRRGTAVKRPVTAGPETQKGRTHR